MYNFYQPFYWSYNCAVDTGDGQFISNTIDRQPAISAPSTMRWWIPARKYTRNSSNSHLLHTSYKSGHCHFHPQLHKRNLNLQTQYDLGYRLLMVNILNVWNNYESLVFIKDKCSPSLNKSFHLILNGMHFFPEMYISLASAFVSQWWPNKEWLQKMVLSLCLFNFIIGDWCIHCAMLCVCEKKLIVKCKYKEGQSWPSCNSSHL